MDCVVPAMDSCEGFVRSLLLKASLLREVDPDAPKPNAMRYKPDPLSGKRKARNALIKARAADRLESLAKRVTEDNWQLLAEVAESVEDYHRYKFTPYVHKHRELTATQSHGGSSGSTGNWVNAAADIINSNIANNPDLPQKKLCDVICNQIDDANIDKLPQRESVRKTIKRRIKDARE